MYVLHDVFQPMFALNILYTAIPHIWGTQQIFEYTVYNCIGIPTRVIEIFLICCLVFLCLNAMIVYFTKHTPYDHR